jgi:hypothetical protein
MATPMMPDPAESQTPVRERPPLHRVGNWSAERWIQFIRDHPDCTLPGGVGALLVQEIDRLTPTKFIQINNECFRRDNP